MAVLREGIMEKVIPRLLRPLETDGNQIQPCLVHGDLWDGNTSVDGATGKPLIFDACSSYAHHECEFQRIPHSIEAILTVPSWLQTNWLHGGLWDTGLESRIYSSMPAILFHPSRGRILTIEMRYTACESQKVWSFSWDRINWPSGNLGGSIYAHQLFTRETLSSGICKSPWNPLPNLYN
jgi:hypothetical protein